VGKPKEHNLVQAEKNQNALVKFGGQRWWAVGGQYGPETGKNNQVRAS
jgi:hypothetical protein